MPRWLLTLVALLMLTRWADARIISVEDTLGSLVCDSDAVVCAVVDDAERVSSPAPGYVRESNWIRVELQVRRTIVGCSPDQKITCYVHSDSVPAWAVYRVEQLQGNRM